MIATFLKTAAFKLGDAITDLSDPYPEFTRPPEIKYPESLATKAKRFEQDFLDNFVTFGGIIWNYRIRPGGLPEVWDVGDQAIWHGVYQAMWAFKYAVEPTTENATRVADGAKGLFAHQTIHGEAKPRLVRGIYRNGSFQDDPSNDSACGHLAGIYFTWKYGPGQLQELCRALIKGLANEIIEHDYSLVLPTGEPTRFGRLVDGILTDPLRLTLCLAILRAAYVMTGGDQYYMHYEKLFNRYWSMIPYALPKVTVTVPFTGKSVTWENTYDVHRAAIQLAILADSESGRRKGLVVGGLQRIRDLESKNGNVWVEFLCAMGIGCLDIRAIKRCKIVLSEFSVEDKGPNVEKINSTRPEVEHVTCFGKILAKQPLPVWRLPTMDFEWQRQRRRLDHWHGNAQPDTLHNGGDYLAAYWLGRLLKFISEDE